MITLQLFHNVKIIPNKERVQTFGSVSVFSHTLYIFKHTVIMLCDMSGVLGHLMALERDGMGQQDQHESQRLEMLKVRAVTLRAQRDQLKHQADAVKVRRV